MQLDSMTHRRVGRPLTVLYDGRCGFCRRLRGWAERQAWDRPIVFLPQQHADVAAHFADIVIAHDASGRPTELVVIESDGTVRRGTEAYLSVFESMTRYRRAARRLMRLGLRGLARRFFAFAAMHRHKLSAALRLRPEPLEQAIRQRHVLTESFDCLCHLHRRP